jgi:hypothetical protein
MEGGLFKRLALSASGMSSFCMELFLSSASGVQICCSNK